MRGNLAVIVVLKMAIPLSPLGPDFLSSQGIMVARPVEIYDVPAAGILKDRTLPIQGILTNRREFHVAVITLWVHGDLHENTFTPGRCVAQPQGSP